MEEEERDLELENEDVSSEEDSIGEKEGEENNVIDQEGEEKDENPQQEGRKTSKCTCTLIFGAIIAVISLAVISCDQYSMRWLGHFNEWVEDNTVFPL